MGENARATASTKMNSVSSRSHSIFTLTLVQKDAEGVEKRGKLNLVDLAGSEKVGKTGASGQTLKEAQKINLSLSALGKCINALVKAKAGTHIPYRDSKLTRMLQESLGGNCKTTLFVACSLHEYNCEETINTLEFAKRAKAIKNKVKVNRSYSVEELLAMVDKLKAQLKKARDQNKRLRGMIDKMRQPGWDPAQDEEMFKEFDAIQKAAAAESRAAKKEGNDVNEAQDAGEGEKGEEEGDDFSGKTLTRSKSVAGGLVKGEDGSTTAYVVDEGDGDPVAQAALEVQYETMKKEMELQIADLEEELAELMEGGGGKGGEMAAKIAELEALVEEQMITIEEGEKMLEEQAKNHESAIEEKETELSTLQEYVAEMEANIDELQAQLEEKDAIIGETGGGDVLGELEDLKAKVAEAENENTELTTYMEEVEAELSAGKEALVEAQADAEEKGMELEALTAELEETMEALAEAEGGKEEDLALLMEELDAAQEKNKTLVAKVAKLEAGGATEGGGEDMAELKIKCSMLEEELDNQSKQAGEKLRKAQAASDKKSEMITKYKKSVADLKGEMAKLKKEHAQATEEKKTASQRLMRMTARISTMQLQADTHSKKHEEAAKSLKEAQAELRKLKDQQTRSKKAFAQAQQAAKMCKRKAEQLNSKVVDLEKKVAESKTGCESHLGELKQHRRDNKFLKAENKQLKEELAALKEELANAGPRRTGRSWSRPKKGADAFAEKIDFSKVLLKDSGTKWLKESRDEAERADKIFRQQYSKMMEDTAEEVKEEMVFTL